MKRTLFPTHAIFHKALILFTFFILIAINSFSQSGAKWATGGNGASSGDFIGTTNFESLVFKTNNIKRGGFTASGDFQLTTLIGTGNRLLQTDADGNIIPFPMGPSTKVLYGDGTWGALPTIPTALWSSSGGNVYYLGKVGIGTNSPTFPLDVIGDARISNNLYVGGGIVITDKVNANSEVKTGKMQADSIVTDSTRGFYGTTKFNGDVKLQNRLGVDGDAIVNGATTVNGNLKTMGSLTVSGNKKIGYTPGSGGGPGIFDFGGPGPITPDPCYFVEPASSLNQFTGLLQSYQSNAAGSGVLSMGFDTENGIIDLAGVGTSGTTSLLINYTCGKDVLMCTGTNGGFVAAGKNFEVGFPIRNEDITVNVKSIAPVGMYVTSVHSGDYYYNTKLDVNRDKTKALAVYNNTTSSENFVVFGDGRVSIGGNYSNPLYMLAVKGQIIAEELNVKLNADWPDYVFKQDYKLMPINELDAYLKKHNHLPEMPTDKEILASGINTSEMITKLLKQQEELTLYIIEQNKRIELLEKEKRK